MAMTQNADYGHVIYRATVGFLPAVETPFAILKPSWYADNGNETAACLTQEEAIAFCWVRWRVPPEQVRVLLPPNDRLET